MTTSRAHHGFEGADAQRADQAMLAFFDRHLKHHDPRAWTDPGGTSH
jgi:hypothetical protein